MSHAPIDQHRHKPKLQTGGNGVRAVYRLFTDLGNGGIQAIRECFRSWVRGSLGLRVHFRLLSWVAENEERG
jgi:hypothetical protein